MATIAGANNNPVTRRNIYPTSPGPTIGGAASTLSPFDNIGGGSGAAAIGPNGQVASTDDVSAAQQSTARGFLGQPLTWFLLLVVLLISLRFIATKLGEGEEFKSVRVSVHNVIVISLAAIIGIGFFKVVFNFWRVPGLTNYINAI